MSDSTVSIEYLGVSGRGPTLTAARQEAARKIQTLIAEGWDPSVISHLAYPGMIAVVVRDGVEHWGTRVLTLAEMKPGVTRIRACTSGIRSREEAEALARNHLAQVVCQVDDDSRSGCELLQGRREIGEHLHWLAWQRSYQAGRARGLTDDNAHAAAASDMGLVAGLAARFLATAR
jgi:hypothetical protein